MNFLDVKTDYAFKKVFGSEQSVGLLRSFLNAILYTGSAQQITELTIVDPYSVPELKGMKDTYVDVKAKLNDNSQVIIEMQVLNHDGFEKRILYNAAKHYSAQLHKGDDYTLVNPVVALTIVDFDLFEPVSPEIKSSPHISRFKLLDTHTFTEYSGDIELVFVELPKFKATEAQLHTLQDQWIYFIKNAGNLDMIPSEMDASTDFKQAFAMINEAGMTPAELHIQYKRREFIIINRGAISKATRTGLEQGIAQGIEQGIEQGIQQGKAKGKAEGKAEGKIEIARTMLTEGLAPQLIAKLTGLSMVEITKLPNA
jgi:predicted transposase/invertase (TIGR01784 family)